MNIELNEKDCSLTLGNEYGERLTFSIGKIAIRNDNGNWVEDKDGNLVFEDTIKFSGLAYDEENAPSIDKTLTLDQVKALASFLNGFLERFEQKTNS